MKTFAPNKGSKKLASGRDVSGLLEGVAAVRNMGMGSHTTKGFFPRRSQESDIAETIPRGTVVMVHLFPTEVIGDFFDSGTGLGSGRWLGWALCDGQSDGPDMEGFFPVCLDATNDNFDVIGNGNNTNTETGESIHGAGTNDHSPHDANHHHSIDYKTAADHGATLCAAGGADVYAWPNSTSEGSGCYNSEGATWDGGSGGGSVAPTGNVFSHSETTNLPPYYVIHFAVKL